MRIRITSLLVLGFLTPVSGLAAQEDQKQVPEARRLRWVRLRDTESRPKGLQECPGGKVELKVSGLVAQLYDGKFGRPIGEPLRHMIHDRKEGQINCWAFSPDGTLLVIGAGYTSGGKERESIGQIRVWDTATGKLVLEYDGRNIGSVSGVAFLKDSKTIQFKADTLEIDGK